MTSCPYCGGELTGELAIPPMSTRKRRIYDAVVNAGLDGIRQPDLLLAMYGGQTATAAGSAVLRVQIFELNKIIAPLKQRVRGQRIGIYRLVEL